MEIKLWFEQTPWMCYTFCQKISFFYIMTNVNHTITVLFKSPFFPILMLALNKWSWPRPHELSTELLPYDWPIRVKKQLNRWTL